MNRIITYCCILFFCSCSTQYRIGTRVKSIFTEDSMLQAAHIGIAVHDPAKNKFLYRFQSDKRFTPASNTKILSSYAAMKYLPERLPAALITDLDTALLITPTGDPSFLHPEFKSHPLFSELRHIKKPIYMDATVWKSQALGSGWSWDDFSEDYMTERSAFPVYGNQIHWYQEKSKKENPGNPADTIDLFIYSVPEIDGRVDFGKAGQRFAVTRNQHSNTFTLFEGKENTAMTSVPFITDGLKTGLMLLEDSLQQSIGIADAAVLKAASGKPQKIIYSQYTDTLLKKMMHRSDNFYADMSLLMVSQLKLNQMDEAVIIRDLLNNDLGGMPQPIRWVDGSGLSRYNQFTPESVIFVLNQLKKEQPWERIKTIFPANGQGTLGVYKQRNDEFIVAKTGTLSGVICLSGYVKNKKGNWLTFSIMINNHNAPTANIRKKMEAFLDAL